MLRNIIRYTEDFVTCINYRGLLNRGFTVSAVLQEIHGSKAVKLHIGSFLFRNCKNHTVCISLKISGIALHIHAHEVQCQWST